MEDQQLPPQGQDQDQEEAVPYYTSPPSPWRAAGGGGEDEMNQPPSCGAAPSRGISKACFLLLFLFLLPYVFLFAATPAEASPSTVGLRGPAVGCNGTIAQCRAEEGEFLLTMDTEIHRRVLQGGQGGYITYPPIRSANRPFCNPGSGNSYTNNCVPPKSNRHTRPCNGIYLCRS